MMSNPLAHKVTANPKIRGIALKDPVTPNQAPIGAIANDDPNRMLQAQV